VALDVALHHHERPDGKGYRTACRATRSRAWRAWRGVRRLRRHHLEPPYKAGWTGRVDRQDGLLGRSVRRRDLPGLRQEPGHLPDRSLVRMRSGRLAVVVEQSERSLVAPRVKVFFSTRSNMPIPVELIDLSSNTGGDAIVARESNAQWKFRTWTNCGPGPRCCARSAGLISRRARRPGRRGSGSPGVRRPGSNGPGAPGCAASRASPRCGAAGRRRAPSRRASRPCWRRRLCHRPSRVRSPAGRSPVARAADEAQRVHRGLVVLPVAGLGARHLGSRPSSS